MRRFIFYFLLFLGWAFAPCLNVANAASNESEASAPLDEGKYQAYVDKIAKATREVVDHNTPPQFPPYGESFNELVAASAENIDRCIRYLAESREPGRERAVAISSMYQLGVDDYVVFVRKLAKLSHSGLLFPRELSDGIYFRYSLVAVEQYNNPKIQALFKEMAAQEVTKIDSITLSFPKREQRPIFPRCALWCAFVISWRGESREISEKRDTRAFANRDGDCRTGCGLRNLR